MQKIEVIVCIVLMAQLATADLYGAENWQERIRAAKAGETIVLPAGKISGGFSVPSGVSLQGAGVDKSFIEAREAAYGVSIDGGKGATISDLTIQNANGAGVVVRNATSVTVSRVRVTGTTTGIVISGAQRARIENCICDDNRFGIAVSSGADCTVVNCTIAGCPEIGISVAASPNAVVFNNCVSGSALCLNIDEPEGKKVDHNLYFGMRLGQMTEQTKKQTITAWRYLTGLDAHSVQIPVEFKNPKSGDFTPISALSWALDRVATSDWGTTELAGVKAPATDLWGQPRTGRPDLGAVETAVKPTRSADGQFAVTQDSGLKSAGVFTTDGILVSYLFQNLPLPKGTYSFWLPERDYVGRTIPAGEYEVRLAESNFKWTYLNHIADNGEDGHTAHSASRNPEFVAFAPGDLVVIQEGPSEDHTGIRAYDAASGKLRWYVHGSTHAQGLAAGKDGMLYYLFAGDRSKGEARLTKIDSATGKVIPFPNSNYGHAYLILSPTVSSLAALGDRLYAADAQTDKLFVMNMADGTLEKTLDVSAPRYVAGDEKTGVLWVASGDSLIALSPDGRKLAELNTVPEPLAVTACDGLLAVASAATGKVHIFDASDPKRLKPLRDVGQGDGPYGPIRADRFLFQRSDGPQDPDFLRASVALDSTGRLAAVDLHRLLMFDNRGQSLWYTIGVFGNQSFPSFSTQNRRFWNTEAEYSFLLNEKDGTWKPEAHWDHSATPTWDDSMQIRLMGDFEDDGKTFVVFTHWPPRNKPAKYPLLTVARLDGFKSMPVLVMSVENGMAVSREDTNGDGRITDEDPATPLVDAHGKPLPTMPAMRRYLQPDGSIIDMGLPTTIWKRTGLNARGVPVYDPKNFGQSLFHADWRQELSPYDYKPDYANVYGGNGLVAAGLLSDGGTIVQAWLRNSGGSPGNNGAGTDLCGYGPDGRRRWVHQLAEHKGIAGLGTVDDITLTAISSCLETLAFDADGLGLGGFCEARQLKYPGYWIDHPNLRLFKMPDGHLHATNGDNASGRHPWYRLDNHESLKKTRSSFHLDAQRAKELAATDEWKPASRNDRPAPPRIRVAHLNQPLPIDGDLAKWRKAGVAPSIIIGPSGVMDGAADCSGVIRIAYEGQNLYFQVLQFDDVPTFHQRDLMFQQDAVELALNGTFPNGFQFITYKNPEGKDTIHRHRFMQREIPARKLAPEHAPRIVRVLDDAKAVTERAALEQLYGGDLSEAKVIVTEFKLPMDKNVWAEAEDDAIPLGPGKEFWIGFFLDDNDQPFTDKQQICQWPATFGMFSPKEEGAVAVCD